MIHKNIDAICVFGFMFVIFYHILFCLKENSDLFGHAAIAENMLNDNKLFSGNFLLYFMANLLSLFSGKIEFIQYAIVFLVSGAETAKFILVKNNFCLFIADAKSRWCSIALLFVYIIPFAYFFGGSGMYIGYYVPNVWHNSTIIFSMPFVILMYLISIKQLESINTPRTVTLIITTILCVWVKPSFFFVFTASYPLMLLLKYGFKRNFFVGIIPVLVGLICLFYEYMTIYISPSDGSSVIINFRKIVSITFLKRQSPYIISSLSFPLLFVILNFKKTIRDKEFWYIFIMLFFSYIISMVCEETGPRAGHGNFYWQIVAQPTFPGERAVQAVQTQPPKNLLLNDT